MLDRIFLSCPTEKAPFGGFHQQEIGSRRDGKKSKVSHWEPREAEHAGKRAERQINPDRHNR